MKSQGISILIAGVIFSAVFASQAPSARAALCEKCRALMFVDSEGKCIDCGGPTSSGALQLCPKCSARRHQCEHCLVKLTAQDEAAAEAAPVEPAPVERAPVQPSRSETANQSAPAWTVPGNVEHVAKGDGALAPFPPSSTEKLGPAPTSPAMAPHPAAETPAERIASAKLKPINPAKPGTYTSGRWRFQLQITGPGTRSEGRWGWLTYDGQKLPRGNVNDYYMTPWGPMYWVGVPTADWGLHGFLPVPLPQIPREGRALALPASLLAATSAPPAGSAEGEPAAKPQTLEINRSHNGQLVRLHVGNVLILRLPGDPATGYQWQAATANSKALRTTVGPQYSPPDSGSAGSWGTYTFVFQAVQPGTGSLRLYYVRANDLNHPRDMFAVGVNVAAATAPPAKAAARSSSVEKR